MKIPPCESKYLQRYAIRNNAKKRTKENRKKQGIRLKEASWEEVRGWVPSDQDAPLGPSAVVLFGRHLAEDGEEVEKAAAGRMLECQQQELQR
jgi:hypothetical protein